LTFETPLYESDTRGAGAIRRILMESTTKRKATRVVSDRKVTATFNTRCKGMIKGDGQGITVTFDFTKVPDERLLNMATSTAIIDFQPVLRALTSEEALEKWDNKTVVVRKRKRKRKARTLSLDLVAFKAVKAGTATEEQRRLVMEVLELGPEAKTPIEAN